MPRGWLVAVVRAYSVMVPAVVILATLLALYSVNHRLPSGPLTISVGWLLAVVTVYSVNVPLGVSLPILLAATSVNQRLPSGPHVMPLGWLDAVGTLNSVKPLTPVVTVATVVNGPDPEVERWIS